MLAQAQQRSGTKGGGILDSFIGQAFGMLVQKHLGGLGGGKDDPLQDLLAKFLGGGGASTSSRSSFKGTLGQGS
jgi:hypothetical protein